MGMWVTLGVMDTRGKIEIYAIIGAISSCNIVKKALKSVLKN